MITSKISNIIELNTFFDVPQLRRSIPTVTDAYALILRFKQSIRLEREAMQRAWDDKDAITFAFHAHRLASAALYLGISGIGQPAAELKDLIAADQFEDRMARLWREFIEACLKFETLTDEQLQMFLNQTSAESSKPFSSA